MISRTFIPPIFFGALMCAALAPVSVQAQSEIPLDAKAKLFPEIGGGVMSLRARGEGAARRYYVLVARAGATSAILVFDADGKRVAQVPAATSGKPLLAYAEDFDVDSAGRIVVSDRSANAIKVFSTAGALEQSISVPTPNSVAALSAGEIAVTSVRTPKLITVFDRAGAVTREIGDEQELSSRKDLNRYLLSGRISTDGADNLYYALTFFPEPTIRKFDRFGYLRLEMELTTLEFQPAAQAARREIKRLEEQGKEPRLKQTFTAVGVDPQTQDIFAALGNVLVHFTPEGRRIATYRIYTADGTRVEASAILIEPTRMLIASDTLGVFEFPRPDKK
ncbi:MAG: hypothetical protein HY046_03960 [Acidobacteria bacterium]|nr:hypothetical protein [Acidobacteriota bacterium]